MTSRPSTAAPILAVLGETASLGGVEEAIIALIIVTFYTSPLWIPCVGLWWAMKQERFSLKYLFALITAEAVSLGAVVCFGDWMTSLWPWAPP
jgi:hypothetical protein